MTEGFHDRVQPPIWRNLPGVEELQAVRRVALAIYWLIELCDRHTAVDDL
jgi:hypothetical protein